MRRIPVWIAADVTGDWTVKPMDVWHDRAVFHFLIAADDRRRYVARLKAALKPGGAVVIATFAPDGPEKCSGLQVCRYSPEALALELGDEFSLVETVRYEHKTPSEAVQPFTYCRFVRVPVEPPILARKDTAAPSVFSPVTVLTEAMRQKRLAALRVPAAQRTARIRPGLAYWVGRP